MTAMNDSPSPPRPASDGTTGVYSITVAAELSGMSVQALRLYERKGLLQPAPHRRRHPPLQRHRHRPAAPHRTSSSTTAST